MARYTMHAFPAGVVLVVLFAGSNAVRGGVEFEIQAHKALIALGEPLIVSTTVHNETVGPVRLYYQNSPAYLGTGESVVAIRVSSDGRSFQSWSDGLRPLIKTWPLTLQPGEQATSELIILFNRNEGFAFDAPGQYWISGTVAAVNAEDPPGNYRTIESEAVQITVTQPVGADRAMWDVLNVRGEQYGRLIQVPWEAKLSDEFLQECMHACEASQSVYVEYLALFLSRWYPEGPNKDAQQAVRFAEIAKAKASSERIRAEAEKLLPRSKPKGAP